MRSFLLFIFLFALPLLAQKPNGTLPVELVYFQGYFADGKVILFWGTVTEVNNYGFNVERKTPNTNWEFIGFVFGSGNSNSPKSYYYEDSTDIQETIYHYRLEQIDNDGSFKYSDSIEISTITKVENETKPLSGFSLEQNYPNPFNPSTKIKFHIPSNNSHTFVTLVIYDVLGNKIAAPINEIKQPGTYELEIGISDFGFPSPSGVYFYQLRTGNFVQTKKFVLLK